MYVEQSFQRLFDHFAIKENLRLMYTPRQITQIVPCWARSSHFLEENRQLFDSQVAASKPSL